MVKHKGADDKQFNLGTPSSSSSDVEDPKPKKKNASSAMSMLNSSITASLLQNASRTLGKAHLQSFLSNADSEKKLNNVKSSNALSRNDSSGEDSEDSLFEMKPKENVSPKSKVKILQNVKISPGVVSAKPQVKRDDSDLSSSDSSEKSKIAPKVGTKTSEKSDSDDVSDSSDDKDSSREQKVRQSSIINEKASPKNIFKKVEKKREVISDSAASSESEEEPQVKKLPFTTKRSVSSSKLDQHFEQKKCKRLDYHHLNLPKLDESAEFYLLQTPKALDVKSLIGSRISLDGNTKIRCEGRKYVFSTSQGNIQPLSLLTVENGRCIIKRDSLKRNIQVHEEAKKVKSKNNSLESSEEVVEMPSNIKVRHPLFGHDYKAKIELDDTIYQKLNETVKEFTKQLKAVKKEKTKKPVDEEKEETIFQMLNEPSEDQNMSFKSKKSKKHKGHQKEEVSSHKSKKRKDDEEMVGPENKKTKVVNSTMIGGVPFTLDFDLSGINLGKSPRRDTKIHSEPGTSGVSKKKLKTPEESHSVVEFNEEHKNADHKAKKKSKDKLFDVEVNNLLSMYMSELNSTEDVPKKKKKHKKQEHLPDGDDFHSQNEQVPSKPKKHKKKQELVQ